MKYREDRRFLEYLELSYFGNNVEDAPNEPRQ